MAITEIDMGQTLKMYPVLGPGISIHRTPQHGMLFRSQQSEIVADKLTYQLSMPSMETINHGGVDVFTACDGTKRVGSVIKNLCGDSSPSRSDMAGFLKFFEYAITQQHIVLKDEPEYQPSRITGTTEFDMPVVATFELTTQCNLRCKHCYRESDSKKPPILPAEKVKSIMNDLAGAGVRFVELTGGEPFLRRDFLEILKHASSVFENIALLTNGNIRKPEVEEFIVENRGKIFLGVSIDSSEPEFHDAFRGVAGSHAKACAFVKRLAGQGVIVRLAMSVVPENSHDIENTLLLGKKLGSLGFAYNPVLPIGRGSDIDWSGISIDKLRKMHSMEKHIIDNYQDTLAIVDDEQIDQLKEWGNCGAGSRTITLDPMGNIRVCQMSDTVLFKLGNITKQPISEIMKDVPAKGFRKLTPPTPEICGDCRYAKLCQYCFVRGYMTFADKEPDCKWAKLHGLKKPEINNLGGYGACAISSMQC